MRLHEVLGGVDVLGWVGNSGVDVTAITHDSRSATRGACFACIRGAVTDGHLHAPEAVRRGAGALLVERELDLPVSQAIVRDVRAALGPAAATFHGHPSRSLRCLGVTGTNGKTTTTYLLEAIARAHGERVGVIGTVGARIDGEAVPLERTTPEADDLQALLARMRDARVGTVPIEVSSHALDQRRVDGTWFASACFTNLTHDHLDYHGTIQAYFESKARLFHQTMVASAAVNVDDRWGIMLTRRARDRGIPVLTFGLSDARRSVQVDVHAEQIEAGRDGTRFTLVIAHTGTRIPIVSSLIGRFNVSNAVAAATTALSAGLPVAAIRAGLEAPLVVPGRLEPVRSGQPFEVLVDYAHTPDALRRVLDTVRPLAHDGRVLVVFGCGGDRDRSKRPEMGRAASTGADLAVLTSDNPRSERPEDIARDVEPGLRSGRARYLVELDRRSAIRAAIAEARPGDVVVIAGKGHETGQSFAHRAVPFDDRVVAREELEAIGCS